MEQNLQEETKEKRAEDFDLKKTSPWWKKYLITLAVGVGMMLLFVWIRGGFDAEITTATRLGAWSDGCFITGVLIAGIGLLTWLSGEGAFDMLGYAIKLGITLIFRTEHESYVDYKVRKNEHKPVCFYLVLVGMFFLLLAGIFTGLFTIFE